MLSLCFDENMKWEEMKLKCWWSRLIKLKSSIFHTRVCSVWIVPFLIYSFHYINSKVPPVVSVRWWFCRRVKYSICYAFIFHGAFTHCLSLSLLCHFIQKHFAYYIILYVSVYTDIREFYDEPPTSRVSLLQRWTNFKKVSLDFSRFFYSIKKTNSEENKKFLLAVLTEHTHTTEHTEK